MTRRSGLCAAYALKDEPSRKDYEVTSCDPHEGLLHVGAELLRIHMHAG